MEYLDDSEKKKPKQILVKLYGNQVLSWDVNIKTYKTLLKLIEKTKSCDRLMDLVPRPYAGFGAAGYIGKQARGLLLRGLADSNGRHYLTCMLPIAAAMRTDFEMSSYGF